MTNRTAFPFSYLGKKLLLLFIAAHLLLSSFYTDIFAAYPEWTIYTPLNSPLPSYPESIAIDQAGNAWIGTFYGLAKFDGTTWTIYHVSNPRFPNGCSHCDWVSSIAIDNRGNVWSAVGYLVGSGYYSKALARFDGLNWTIFDPYNSGLPGSVVSIAIDASGNKWIGTSGYGLVKFDDANWVVYNTSNSGLHTDWLTPGLAIDSDGALWIGTAFGVAKYDGSNWDAYDLPGNLGYDWGSVTSIAVDKTGHKWFGTPAGLAKFDGNACTVYDSTNVLPGDWVTSVAVDMHNNKWIGITPSNNIWHGNTGGGLAKFDGTTWTTFTEGNSGLPDDSVLALALDKTDQIWIGTNGGNAALSILTYPGSQGIISLPQTGQTKCYDRLGAGIPCAGTGQDGELQTGVEWPIPRFLDNGDGTITDKLTGLMWLKDANCAKMAGYNPNGTSNGQMTWQHTLDFVAGINNKSIDISACSSTNYNDWRLPNIVELLSLVDHEKSNPAVSEVILFKNIQGLWYTSSTTVSYYSSPFSNWVVDFSNGYIGASGKTSLAFFAWPVRGGENGRIQLPVTGQVVSYYPGDDGDLRKGLEWSGCRFSDNGDGTVTDTFTGLMWTKNVEVAILNWKDALDYVKGMNSGIYEDFGYNDWRLPNINELRSLMDLSKAYPTLPEEYPFTNIQNAHHWSSTTLASNGSEAWEVSFWYGEKYHDSKGRENLVWPVRSGQGSFHVPEISVAPNPLVFGNVYVGDTADQTIMVSNDGTANLVIGTITSPSPPFSKQTDSCSGQNIPPAGTCTVTYRFAPTSDVTYSRNSDIPSNDPNASIVTVVLTGVGVSSNQPDITVTPLSVDFGSVNVGDTAYQVIKVKNQGSANLVIGTITNPSVPFSKQGDNCSGWSIPPSGTCTLWYLFAPTSEGTYSSNSSIPSSDPDESEVSVTLSGTGVDFSFIEDFIEASNQFIGGAGVAAGQVGQVGDYFLAKSGSDQIQRGIDLLFNGIDLLLQGVKWSEIGTGLNHITAPGYNAAVHDYWKGWTGEAAKHWEEGVHYSIRDNGQLVFRKNALAGLNYVAKDAAIDVATDRIRAWMVKTFTPGSDKPIWNYMGQPAGKLANSYRSELLREKNDLLGSLVFNSLTPEEILSYQVDMSARHQANAQIFSQLIDHRNLLWDGYLKSVEDEANWWKFWGPLLVRWGVIWAATLMFEGPGYYLSSLGCSGAQTILDYVKDTQALKHDAKMVDQSFRFLTGRTSQLYTTIALNSVNALNLIRSRETPKIAAGNVEVTALRSIGHYRLWPHVWWAEEGSEAELSIDNTSPFQTSYLTSAVYNHSGFWIGTERLLPEGQALELEGNACAKAVIGFKSDDRGESPDEGSDVDFLILGYTETGLYPIANMKKAWNPVRVEKDTGLAVRFLGQYGGLEYEESRTLPFPLSSSISLVPGSQDYEIVISVLNPFDFIVNATITQAIPAGVELIDAGDAQISDNSLSWSGTIDPFTSIEVRVVIRWPGILGESILIPAPELIFEDPKTGTGDSYTGSSRMITGIWPLKVSVEAPVEWQMNQTISSSVSISNISATVPVEASLIAKVATPDGILLWSQSEEINLPGGGSQVLTLTVPVPARTGYVVYSGDASVGLTQRKVFQELINITGNQTYYVIEAVATLGGSINPSGVISVFQEDNQTFGILADTGYHLVDVVVDGVSQGAITSYTFNNVTEDHTIVASFAINTYTLAASAGSNGNISPSGAVVVNYGTDNAFVITPSTGYHVADVLVDGISVGAVTSYTFTNVAADHTIEAMFEINTYTLEVGRSGLGSGTVTSTPPGIDCGTDCSEDYQYGTSVVLTATPKSNSVFAGWTEDCTGIGPCEVTMDAEKTVGAIFDLLKHTVALIKTGTGSGIVTSSPPGIDCGTDCSEDYIHGTKVKLAAEPSVGSVFSGWTGGCVGCGACDLLVDGEIAVTAIFTKIQTFPFLDDFSTDMGWFGYEGGKWERRPSAEGGGEENGNPDPGSDHTGSEDNYILGFAIGGDYPNDLVEESSIISPPIDCTGQDQVLLRFWRYLDVEGQPFDFARIYVSDNSTDWTMVWENPAADLTDSEWTQVVIDISEFASDQATVHVKFSMGPTNSTKRFSGWNIDDFEIRSTAVDPPAGTIGNEFRVWAPSLGTKKGKVLLDGTAQKVVQWTDGWVDCLLSKPGPPGTYDLTLVPGGGTPITFADGFTVMSPQIESVTPPEGSPLDEISITGKFFGSKKGKVLLEYVVKGKTKTKSCKIMNWTMNEIGFLVPKGLAAGTYPLKVINSVDEATGEFTIVLP